MKIYNLLLAFSFFSSLSYLHLQAAPPQTQIDVYAKEVFKAPIALSYFSVSTEKNQKETENLNRQLYDILRQDLDFTNYFIFIPPESFLEDPRKMANINYSLWRQLKIKYLITGALKIGETIDISIKVVSIDQEKTIYQESKSSSKDGLRTVMHQFSNEIYEKLTGDKGIFLTKIAFISNHSGFKELYTMDYDGNNIEQLTRLKNIVMLPSWAPSGNKILFSSYATRNKRKNLDLFEIDTTTKQIRTLSKREGLNMGATYSPDGHTIALTLSINSYPNIYFMKPDSSGLHLAAASPESDFSPTFSPDGKKILFVSTRSGNPHLFIKDISQSVREAQRLTYAGKYNAAPQWSKSANKIVFAGQLESHFDLFSIDPKGFVIERLTKSLDNGHNEHPSWSPNGRHIVFYSTRSNKSDIYIITANGSLEKRITHDFGKCLTPAWGPL
ncbi:MAG: PD40 domain-containing protein [Deltaproteobacteria bacterium]|nr:PD40 domain-containing protein [Deltaproteobacteria bacterium]